MHLFPVPANLELNVRLSAEGALLMQLFDMQGKVWMQQTLSENSSTFTLKTEQLPTGNYLLKVVHKDGRVSSRKFTKVD